MKCAKCGQEIVQRGMFWVLVSEEDAAKVTFCPEGGIHEPEEDA